MINAMKEIQTEKCSDSDGMRAIIGEVLSDEMILG